MLVQQVDFTSLVHGLQHVNVLWVIVALASVTGTVWIRAMRWRVLLSSEQAPSSPLALSKIIAVGQVLNAVMPVRAGELVRAYLGGERGATGKLFALGTIVAEKVLDMAMWLVLAGTALIWLPLPDWVPAGTGISLLVIGGSVLVLIFIRSTFGRVFQDIGGRSRLGQMFLRWFEALWEGVVTLRQPGVLWPALLWSVLLWGIYLFNNLAVFYALGMRPGVLSALLVLVVLQAGTAPPSTPAKIGVFEYLCVLALGWLGIAPESALTYGVVLHAVVMIPPLVLVLLPVGPRIAIWRTTQT